MAMFLDIFLLSCDNKVLLYSVSEVCQILFLFIDITEWLKNNQP